MDPEGGRIPGAPLRSANVMYARNTANIKRHLAHGGSWWLPIKTSEAAMNPRYSGNVAGCKRGDEIVQFSPFHFYHMPNITTVIFFQFVFQEQLAKTDRLKMLKVRICILQPLSLGDFLCIPTPNTGQLNPLFHTFAEFRLIVNRIVVRQPTDWLAANVQFSPNVHSF